MLRLHKPVARTSSARDTSVRYSYEAFLSGFLLMFWYISSHLLSVFAQNPTVIFPLRRQIAADYWQVPRECHPKYAQVSENSADLFLI